MQPGLPRSGLAQWHSSWSLIPYSAPGEFGQAMGLGHNMLSELGWLCGLWLATEEMERGKLR